MAMLPPAPLLNVDKTFMTLCCSSTWFENIVPALFSTSSDALDVEFGMLLFTWQLESTHVYCCATYIFFFQKLDLMNTKPPICFTFYSF
jgi:hypothetical protein